MKLEEYKQLWIDHFSVLEKWCESESFLNIPDDLQDKIFNTLCGLSDFNLELDKIDRDVIEGIADGLNCSSTDVLNNIKSYLSNLIQKVREAQPNTNHKIIKLSLDFMEDPNCLDTLNYVSNRLSQASRGDLIFKHKELEHIRYPNLVKQLSSLTYKDVEHGFLWELDAKPENHGFIFYYLPSHIPGNESITNIPYLVFHHSPTGFSWGYSGSGPSDLGLNLMEYFCRKEGYIVPRCVIWNNHTVSDLAFEMRFVVRDYINKHLGSRPFRNEELLRFTIPYDEVASAMEKIFNYAKSEHQDSARLHSLISVNTVLEMLDKLEDVNEQSIEI